MSLHAALAPSKAPRWVNCIGSIALCADVPDKGSIYADEGTAAHSVGAAWISNDFAALKEAAIVMRSFYKDEADYIEANEQLKVYVDAVLNAAQGKILMVEQRLDISRWTSEKDGKGTADTIIVDLQAEFIEVWDLKFGKGKVVYAPDNEQTMLYALGALDLVEMIYGPMKFIRMVICQPRRDHISEHVISREDLLAFGERALASGKQALELVGKPIEEIIPFLHPADAGCTFCPVKANCPALTKQVQDMIFEEFSVVESGEAEAVVRKVGTGVIPNATMLELASDWIAAQYAWIDERLRAGIETPGWKLVLGKKGNRKWIDEAKVEELLKSLKLNRKKTHEEKLLPLTKLEKLVPKPKWPVFEQLITQSDAQPIAVSSSDKRAEYIAKSTVESFEEVTFDAFK